MVEPLLDNLKAYRYGSFAHSWDEFGYDIFDKNFYGHIRNSDTDEKVGEFSFVKGEDLLIATLSTEALLEIPIGTYKYDVLQVDSDGSNPVFIISGTILIHNGSTRIFEE